MMKNRFILLMLFIGFLGFLVSTPNTYAYPVNPVTIGDSIKFADGPGTTNGGEFKVSVLDPEDNSWEYRFNTFCLETNENIDYSKTFTVYDISTEAKNGGSGGPSPDPLDERTAYLYHQFFWGNLTAYNYDGSDTSVFGTRAASADALQKAIWWFEGETNGTANYYTALAQSAVDNNLWEDLGDVRVINLKYADGTFAQDQLTVVPEPATMLLFGTGLIGLAGLGRRKFRKK